MIKAIIFLIAAYLVARCYLRRLPKAEVNTIIAIVLLGSFAAIGFGIELWPFSHYPMFAGVQTERETRFRLYGVTDERQPREVPLLNEYLYPFAEVTLVFSFNRFSRTGNEASMQRAARDCLRRYERRRLAGLHDGPPLKSVRLYEAIWRFEKWTGDRDTPLEKRLILEVSLAPSNRRDFNE